MGMSRCYSLMKCMLIIFNIIFLMVGCAVCCFSAWALYDGGAGAQATSRAGLCALAAWGCVLTAGAMAALVGAVRGSASLLAGAFALLALSGVAEGAAAWWSAAHLPGLRAALTAELARQVRSEYGRAPAATSMLDAIQNGLQCCGVRGLADWQDSSWARSDTRDEAVLDLSVSAPAAFYRVPESCCTSTDEVECSVARLVASAGSAGGGGLHTAGCGPRVLAALAGAARVPLAAGAALLATHALALLLALALCLRAHPTPRYKA